MRVFCYKDSIGPSRYQDITIGKWYESNDIISLKKTILKGFDYFYIINDKNMVVGYHKSLFKTTNEVRIDKLNDIGI